MVFSRKFVVACASTIVFAFTDIVGTTPFLGSAAWAQGLTASDREDAAERRKKRQQEAEDKETWDTVKGTAKDTLYWAIDEGIGKVFKPLEVVPASGTLVSKFKPTARGLYRYFIEEPWMRDMYNQYTGMLRKIKTAAFNRHRKTHAEIEDIDQQLENAKDDEERKRLEDARRRLQQDLDATDRLMDNLDLRLGAAERAKDEYDKGGDVPAAFPKLLQQLNDEVKEMQDRRDPDAAAPEEEVSRCDDLREQQVEIERKLYAEFQRRRGDPGMVLEAQRAMNEKQKIEAQMATCAD